MCNSLQIIEEVCNVCCGPAVALRRSVHRRFVKGLPPGAGRMFTGQTDEESFWFGLLIHAPIGVFLFLLILKVSMRMISSETTKPIHAFFG